MRFRASQLLVNGGESFYRLFADSQSNPQRLSFLNEGFSKRLTDIGQRIELLNQTWNSANCTLGQIQRILEETEIESLLSDFISEWTDFEEINGLLVLARQWSSLRGYVTLPKRRIFRWRFRTFFRVNQSTECSASYETNKIFANLQQLQNIAQLTTDYKTFLDHALRDTGSFILRLAQYSNMCEISHICQLFIQLPL